jgi:hypothetical protein
MTKRFNLKDFRPETLTTSKAVAREGLITDGELYYHLNSCPFFHTYNDGRVEETETILLPFFRRFLKDRMLKPLYYKNLLGALNEYLASYKDPILPKDLKKYIRYFTNFYSLLHPTKRFEILLPYFPYQHTYLTGCAELVIRTRAGVRIYVYDFTDGPIDAEDLNFNGFRLQLAGNIFQKLSGETPTSLACLYPGTKTVVYYTFKSDERLDEMIIQKEHSIRRYGTHCAYCLQRDCSPLIDRKDKYGWKHSEKG